MDLTLLLSDTGPQRLGPTSASMDKERVHCHHVIRTCSRGWRTVPSPSSPRAAPSSPRAAPRHPAERCSVAVLAERYSVAES
ncbi:hypothetical protein DAI22_10g200750 [Oryza sativa Japonica Group]|nr:hypothetical protein DAI22_10g200750 [Oryza sativa Japonica Group]